MSRRPRAQPAQRACAADETSTWPRRSRRTSPRVRGFGRLPHARAPRLPHAPSGFVPHRLSHVDGATTRQARARHFRHRGRHSGPRWLNRAGSRSGRARARGRGRRPAARMSKPPKRRQRGPSAPTRRPHGGHARVVDACTVACGHPRGSRPRGGHARATPAYASRRRSVWTCASRCWMSRRIASATSAADNDPLSVTETEVIMCTSGCGGLHFDPRDHYGPNFI